MPQLWKDADAISDRIVRAINDELKRLRQGGPFDPIQLLAGQLLAFKALQASMPESKPYSLDRLYQMVDQVLRELLERQQGH